jgi:hypothetical protein
MPNDTPPPPSPPPRRLPLYLLGVFLFFLGPAIYALRLSMGILTFPWYVPALATIGVFFGILSVGQRRGWMRTAFLFVLVFICGFEWFMVLVGIKTPEYHGPAEVGRPLPTFVASLADGKSFSDKDLETGKPSVLLFFRGRW